MRNSRREMGREDNGGGYCSTDHNIDNRSHDLTEAFDPHKVDYRSGDNEVNATDEDSKVYDTTDGGDSELLVSDGNSEDDLSNDSLGDKKVPKSQQGAARKLFSLKESLGAFGIGSKSSTWRVVRCPADWFLVLVLMAVLMGGAAGGSAGTSRKPAINLGGGNNIRACPPAHQIAPCMCTVISKGLDIICDHVKLSAIRKALDILRTENNSIYWMKFRNCHIARLPKFIFMGLSVNHLNIIRSNVSVIEGSSLSALGQSLEALDLSTNLLTQVPTEALKEQTTLTFLNLNYNNIESLHDSAFYGMIMLERLTLYENRIKHIHINTFKGMNRLSRLNLGKNRLSDIPSDSFHMLINIEVLDLHENSISHIPTKAFVGLKKLDMLKLEHNNIDHIQDNVFLDLKQLNSLNIEHNIIVNISNHAFAGLEENLGWLELGNNRLNHIPSQALRPLHSLRQLDLDSNRIGVIQDDAFRGYGDTLKYIALEKNHIENIPPLALVDLHSLEWLKLGHNELTDLEEDTVMPIMDTIKILDLSNNPLVCSCDILWLRHWLLNPNNQDNIDRINDHICVTRDQKQHVIKNLPQNAFNCPHPQIGSIMNTASAATLVSSAPMIVFVATLLQLSVFRRAPLMFAA